MKFFELKKWIFFGGVFIGIQTLEKSEREESTKSV